MTPNRYGSITVFILYLVALLATASIFSTLFDSFSITASFWISLLMIILAETAIALYSNYLIQNLEQVKRVMPGFLAVGAVILIYFLVVVAFSLLTGIAGLALRWFILVHILALALTVIGIGLILLLTKSTQDHEQHSKNQIVNIHHIESALKELQRKIQLLNLSETDEIEVLIKKLIEKVHYSDPVTTKPIHDMDQQFLERIQSLEMEVSSVITGEQELSPERILQYIDDLNIRLKHRNELLILSK